MRLRVINLWWCNRCFTVRISDKKLPKGEVGLRMNCGACRQETLHFPVAYDPAKNIFGTTL